MADVAFEEVVLFSRGVAWAGRFDKSVWETMFIRPVCEMIPFANGTSIFSLNALVSERYDTKKCPKTMPQIPSYEISLILLVD